MIVGIGIDQIEVARMGAFLRRRPARAARRLFTPAERQRCSSRTNAAECFAARFAAKEAFLKALGTGLAQGIGWQDVEVRLRDGGRPELHLGGAADRRMRERGGERVHLSVSHDAGMAVAVAVIEGAGG